MQFPKNFPDILRSNILPSQVISKTVKLKKRGKEHSGLCPFHNENTPSFTVNDQKGFYHCFGCGAHGDIITYVMEKEGLDFKESVVKLANDFSIAIPQVKNFNYKQEDGLKKELQIAEEICQFFETNLFAPQFQDVRNYLKGRGITGKIAKKFRLGFALDSYDALVNLLKEKGYSEADLLKTGVIAKNDRGSIYDKMRGRVIFPIANKKGQIIAFGGRALSKDVMPKYLNSAETNLFRKKQTLYNINLARNAIFQELHAVIVEGYMDVIALSKSGIENAVAGLGTALSEQHLQQLFTITDKIIVFLDGDNAGFLAAQRLCDIALNIINSKKNIFFAFLPQGMDPDDFIVKYGVAKAKELLAQAKTMSQAMVEFALFDLKITDIENVTAEAKARFESQLQVKVDLIKDPLTKKYFAQYFKDYAYKLGRKSFSKNKYNKPLNKVANFTTPKLQDNLSDSLAKSILCYIIKKPELAGYSDDNFNVEDIQFDNENLTKIKDKIVEIIDLQNDLDENKIIQTLEKYDNSNDLLQIKDILCKIALDEHYLIKFKILLYKDLLTRVELQYKDSLAEVEDIETHQSAVLSLKIKEIFDYKNSLEKDIAALEQEVI